MYSVRLKSILIGIDTISLAALRWLNRRLAYLKLVMIHRVCSKTYRVYSKPPSPSSYIAMCPQQSPRSAGCLLALPNLPSVLGAQWLFGTLSYPTERNLQEIRPRSLKNGVRTAWAE
jgi:hypothetical protein